MEGMDSHAVNLIISCNSLPVLAHYHKKLSTKYPKEYFVAYRKLVVEFAKSRIGRNHYSVEQIISN